MVCAHCISKLRMKFHRKKSICISLINMTARLKF